MAAMTSGSIGTSSINISPVGEHSEARTSDLTVVQKFLWCDIYIFDTTGRKRFLWTGQPDVCIVARCIVASSTTSSLGV